ncbi:hypothetical protein D0C36_22675 [Mucilaginibacter conchicola]|uniref:DUF3836 domain-containing protein n=1 Tax=Mucilaginibacter conchicola TaxID=2303333 RepID=A0A372NP86_9SPHI|nr:hypothetical protein [Mucilaginibacter conchicola]RFZ90053.1 hypothetical protein D0C36_22675 [Mucilaginibacter conchicola]
MKNSKFIAVSALIVAYSCNLPASNNLSGTYVHNGKNEYSVAYDTIRISPITDGKTYNVSEHIGYHPIKDGILRPKEFKIKTWQATWDQEKNTLSENQFAQQFYYDPKSKTLTSGSAIFLKIKDN